MKQLPTSISDNWYTDLYPTWIDSLGFAYPIRPLATVLRAVEIFFYRRAQLKYYE